MQGPHRFVCDEPRIPFHPSILYEDRHILVIDKPHYLPTTPRGMWYRSTALMYMRDLTHNNDLIPAHRLDRMTAGIVVLVKNPVDRGAYQLLFQNKRVHKMYECVAPAPSRELTFPCDIRSYIQKDVGALQAYEKDLPPNSHTRIEIKEKNLYSDDDRDMILRYPQYAIYRLFPSTGKTHQLRLHMNNLGLPIMNDPLYPRIRFEKGEEEYENFSHPLQLIARMVEFEDPFTGEKRKFISRMRWDQKKEEDL